MYHTSILAVTLAGWTVLTFFLDYSFLALLNALLTLLVVTVRVLHHQNKLHFLIGFDCVPPFYSHPSHDLMLFGIFLVCHYTVSMTGGLSSPLKLCLVVLPLFPLQHHFLWGGLVAATYRFVLLQLTMFRFLSYYLWGNYFVVYVVVVSCLLTLKGINYPFRKNLPHLWHIHLHYSHISNF